MNDSRRAADHAEHPPTASTIRPRAGGRQHYALGVLASIYVLHFIDRQILTVLIEPIKQEFGASDTQMGLLTGLAFALFYALLGVPIARLADSASRRNIIAACCAVWSAFTVVCGQAGSYTTLLLARIGVATGEAGGTAPMISMVSDLYPRAQRPIAMAVLGLGPHIGIVFGLTLGGWIAHHYGWRAAFAWMGAPGILMAVVLFLTVREPKRGTMDEPAARNAVVAATPAKEREKAQTLQQILARPAVWVLLLAVGMAGFVGYGFGSWNVSFLVRTHGMSLQQAGVIAGLTSGTGAIFGTLLAGWLCKHLSARDPAWQLRVPAIGLLLSMIVGWMYCMSPVGAVTQLGSLSIPVIAWFSLGFGFFAPWWTAQSFAAIANLAPPAQRALASSLLVLSVTLIGGGLGPVFTGIVSDALVGGAGDDALRYALVATISMTLIPALLYLAAAPLYRRSIV
jgi:predicted MFS family arabinose efflux permease